MPRIYTSCSDPLDFHRSCFPSLDEAEELYGLEVCGEGPDGRGDCFSHDDSHPSYDDDDYDCHACGGRLTGDDD